MLAGRLVEALEGADQVVLVVGGSVGDLDERAGGHFSATFSPARLVDSMSSLRWVGV